MLVKNYAKIEICNGKKNEQKRLKKKQKTVVRMHEHINHGIFIVFGKECDEKCEIEPKLAKTILPAFKDIG